MGGEVAETLKILVFNWRCWLNPAMGGAEVFTFEILKRLARMGHQVTLFTSEFSGSKTEEVLDGIQVVRSGGKYSVYGRARKYYEQRFSKMHFDYVIDEVNTRPFMTPKFVKGGEKVVALIHQLAREYWFYETPFPISYIGYHYLENRWLKNYRDVPTLTVSESTRKDLQNLGFKKVTVVPEGLNFEPLSHVPAKEDFPVLVYNGRLKRAKRPDDIVKAFSTVRSRFPKAELWVIGDGDFKKELVKMADEGVKFFGSLANGARRNMVQRAWILVNPSVREGFGLNIVEANALGVPCVAYSVGGLRDSIKDGVTGYLVESGNIQALSDRLISLLNEPSVLASLSKNALNYARGFSWDKAADECIRIISGLE